MSEPVGRRILDMKQVLGGLAAAAVVGTASYSIWKGAPGRLLPHLQVLFFYLPLPYLVLYLLRPAEKTDLGALGDRIGATLTAVGLLALWGWFVTVPLTPQNAQAPIGLFFGWVGAAGFYGAIKIVVYVIRKAGDQE